MKSQELRKRLSRLKLPEEPGVYIFRDYQKRPLYIGRATSLRDRTKSYFGIDLIETRGPRLVDMVTKARSLTWQVVSSVLEAVLLESSLIKKYQPYYNVAERDDKSDQYVVITAEEWPRVFLVRARDFENERGGARLPYEVKASFGPFTESGLIKEALKILRKLFPFRDKKAHDPRHESFYRAIGQSPDKGAHREYMRTIKYLTLFFQGNSDIVRKLVEKEMKANARVLKFEEAAKNRSLLYALDHVNDIALIKRNSSESGGNTNGIGGVGYRIEAYDVAHLSGTNVVGSMTVAVNGQLVNSEYRKFKISRETNNDLAGLVEILSRRLNHTEWEYPDLIVVDGNEVQKRGAEAVLQARRISIPVVAVTKDERHKASKIIGDENLVRAHKAAIISANSEAHRYALAYHRKRRSTMLG